MDQLVFGQIIAAVQTLCFDTLVDSKKTQQSDELHASVAVGNDTVVLLDAPIINR